MSSVFADTHTIAWFLGDPVKLSASADMALANAAADSNGKIFVSAISVVEIQYLIEKGRISTSVLTSLLSELNNLQTTIEIVPVDYSVALNITQISRADVADMPDRIIAVTASLLGLPLISADKALQSCGISVIW